MRLIQRITFLRSIESITVKKKKARKKDILLGRDEFNKVNRMKMRNSYLCNVRTRKTWRLFSAKAFPHIRGSQTVEFLA